ncbi:class I SAM-dependent methyltransferase [Nocardia sp. NPDC050793]|uniref:class I SAM-dependent methyltransferase n=1 Tax=Nocardia sp. NPDC050793 TaxID=3155159 RepID=UPI0033D19556
MRIADRLWDSVASQLGRPHGIAGRVVGRILNRGNYTTVAAAVAATEAGAGATVADVGFGGGIGLDELLAAVGETGTVHGLEIAPTMLDQAGKRYRAEIAAGRLVLHAGAMHEMPLATASLDAAISTNTVYFIDDLGAAFAELARVLRPSGRVVLGVGDPADMARMPFTENRFRLRPIAEIVEHLQAAGLVLREDRRISNGRMQFHLLVCEKPHTQPK